MEESIIPPVEHKSVQKLPRRTIIIGAIIASVFAITAALFLVNVDGYRLLDRLVIQNELRGIFVVERTVNDIKLQSFGILGIKHKKIKGVSGSLDDYASGGKVAAAVVTSTDSGLQEVWLLGAKPVLLATGPAAKASIAVSSDGTFIAYASRTDESNAFSGKLSSWTVHIVDVATGRDIELGTGFDPEFFVKEGVPYLLFTSADGVVVNSLVQRDTFNGFITPFTLLDAVDHAAKVSPDGAYLAFKDPSTRAFSIYGIYRVTADLPLGIEPLLSPENFYTDITFVKNVAYGIDNRTAGSGVVWKMNLDESATETERYTFPTTYTNRFIR